MTQLNSSNTQYAIVPLTFRNASGDVTLPPGSLKAIAHDGGSAAIVEEPGEDGGTVHSVRLVTPPGAGNYKFSVEDNTPEGDNLIINPLEFLYTTSAVSEVEVLAGVAEFRPKSELPV
jgi:hypothetical protein